MDFSDIRRALDDSPFAETPVGLDEFLGKNYLGDQLRLSNVQRELVEAMSQIYKIEDCMRLYGPIEGANFYKKNTKTEVTMALGKGSGKDLCSTVGCAYLVYKLLCLKDPAAYFGKPPGDAIDIINIAINAQQARNVFFKGFMSRIKHAPWFRGKYNPKADSIEFDKSVTVYSGHSERESHEGLNLILAVLDEISGFSMMNNTGNTNAKTAEAIYDAFRASVDSRFPTIGKAVLLSFPRHSEDFITKHYNRMVVSKSVEQRSHTFVIDPDLPPIEGNTFEITWERDTIHQYAVPGILCVRAPSWEVNPTRQIEDYKNAFLLNPNDAYQRFACMPRAFSDGLFRDPEMIESRMVIRNPVDELHRLDPSWEMKDVRYFLHADLAQKQDRAAIAMAHVDGWVTHGEIMGSKVVSPRVIVDFVTYWQPTREQSINLSELADWIVSLKRRGIPLHTVTTDRWHAHDFQLNLRNMMINTDTLSVARKHYDELVMAVLDNRVALPRDDILLRELTQLKIVSDKQVDHPRSGSKDLADAVCGAVYNATTLTPRRENDMIDVIDQSSLRQAKSDAIVQLPPMPSDIADWVSRMQAV